jgi:hypothetical protein
MLEFTPSGEKRHSACLITSSARAARSRAHSRRERKAIVTPAADARNGATEQATLHSAICLAGASIFRDMA